jgi:hypothetical protein
MFLSNSFNICVSFDFNFIFVIILFERETHHTAQAGLELVIYSLNLLSARITAVCHHS